MAYRVAGVYGSDVTETMERLANERDTHFGMLSSPDAANYNATGFARALHYQLNEFAPVAAGTLAIETEEFLRAEAAAQ